MWRPREADRGELGDLSDGIWPDGPDGGAPCWQVTAPWQWLGLDVRGPLPPTPNGHRYVLSVTDYFSKWVEAVPVESCLPSCVAKHVADVVAHFGFPLRILSRLPHDIIQKVRKWLPLSGSGLFFKIVIRVTAITMLSGRFCQASSV